MERIRQNVRGGEPNIATVHHLMSDGAPEDASRATNHPLSHVSKIAQPGTGFSMGPRAEAVPKLKLSSGQLPVRLVVFGL